MDQNMKVRKKSAGQISRKRSDLMIFLKMGCILCTLWPIPSSAPKWRVTLIRIMLCIHITIELTGLIAVINGLYCCFTSISEIVKSFVEATFMVEVLFNLTYHIIQSSNLEPLTIEMYNFFNISKPRDMGVPRIIYYSLMSIFIVGSILFFMTPYFSKVHVTPLNTVYFMLPRETRWGQAITFTLNSIQIVNAVSVVLLDLLILSIIWHAAYKFKLLGRELKKLSKTKMRMWIVKHQRAIKYARKVNLVMAPLAIKSTIAVTLYMIVCGLVVTHVPTVELTKFYMITVLSMVRYVGCSFAVDTMTQEAEDIAWHIYSSPWLDANPKLRRWFVLIMQRCQKPIVIHTTAFLSAWSLRFCGQVFYTILTFFSALKVALHV